MLFFGFSLSRYHLSREVDDFSRKCERVRRWHSRWVFQAYFDKKLIVCVK